MTQLEKAREYSQLNRARIEIINNKHQMRRNAILGIGLTSKDCTECGTELINGTLCPNEWIHLPDED